MHSRNIATCSRLIIPDSIHAKPRLLDIQMRDPPQKLVFPPINLHKPLLIVAHSEPLIVPRARADSIAMPAARRSRIKTNLPLNSASLVELESRNVACQFGRVGPRGGEEVFSGAGSEDDVRAVHFGVQGVVPGRDERVGVVVVDWLVG